MDRLAAECGIRQLYARYVDAVWRRDTPAFLDCFAQDGEWKIAGQHVRGREAIGRLFEALTAPAERVLMLTGPTVLDFDDDAASGRTLATELIKLKDGRGVRTLGVYYERFVEQGARWRFRWRHFDLFYYGPRDLSEAFFPSPDYGPPPAMPADDAQTYVRSKPENGG